MDFPDDPRKQSWQGADNKGFPCWISWTQRVCFTVCLCVSVCKRNHGSKRMIHPWSKAEWRHLKSLFSRLVLSSLPFALMYCFTGLATWIQLFDSLSYFKFIYYFRVRLHIERTIKWLYASTVVILTPEQICTENILNNNFHLCWELQRGRTRTEMCFMNLWSDSVPWGYFGKA